ncbi:uncharacterized protein LOC127363544 isoform X2 [Xyrichtys novacula]|uniref:Uncharacterized protein LOC127363544 isoform X2 n=1 Tax=Xyrichtys novacula TaxID=13765 RepID=A0AAV1HKS7_XYRNO|nr:uncharacterized protein LOC127363544 isoform X2 [Xyrichtys novacula]
MSDNSSSSSDSLLHRNHSSVSLPFSVCFIARPSSFMYFAYFITQILLILPLCILILHQGFQRWQQQRSNAAAASMSNLDCFTYHIVIIELIGVLGLSLCSTAVFTLHVRTFWAGYCLFAFTWYGELFMNILTCVERFLAVIHPVTYLTLRSERGIRIRNVSIGCVWMFSLGEVGLLTTSISAQMDIVVLTSCLVIISFCSLSVLSVLIRPGPGNQGGDRKSVSQSKQKAFFTISLILVVLSLRCVWNLTWTFLFVSKANQCLVMGCGVWLNLPTSLVLPVLFLQRSGISGFGKTTK